LKSGSVRALRFEEQMSFVAGPEMFWIVVWLASKWLAGRNAAPDYSFNDTLSTLYWVGPSIAVVVSYTLCFQFKMPAPSWWLLVRFALAACVGVCFSTSALAEKIEAGSARSGLAMGIMVAIAIHWLVIGCMTVTGIIFLLRSGGAQPMWAFLKQGGVAAAVITGLGLLVSFVSNRQTEGMSGEEKARLLSRAHGEKIGAKFSGDWRGGRKNWTNFEISFVPPNSVRLTSTVKYGDHRKPGDVRRHLEKWNGDVGASFLEFIGAKRPWRATWDAATESLIWSVDIDMRGLTKSRFLNDTDEAARLYIGPLSGWAGSDTWWLFGEAIDAAVEVEKATGSRSKFALTWLDMALGQAAMYCERAGFQGRLKALEELKAEAHRLGTSLSEAEPAATRSLLEQVRAAESWKQIAHAESDFAFLLNGSLRYVGLARAYVERNVQLRRNNGHRL
jgi:hypothetical protein